MLTMPLIEGLSSAQGGRLNVKEYQSCATEYQREELYIKSSGHSKFEDLRLSRLSCTMA